MTRTVPLDPSCTDGADLQTPPGRWPHHRELGSGLSVLNPQPRVGHESVPSMAVDADELLAPDGHLYRVTDKGLVDRGVVDDFEALVAANAAIDEAWEDGAPEFDDWVLVLGVGNEAGHHRLLDVSTGERFAWQGRLFDTRAGSGGDWEIRDTGQVLARVTDTFKRMAVDEVIDLAVVFSDGSETVLTGTYEHPFWVEARQEWVKLGELARGDVLTTDGGGEAVVVVLRAKPGANEVFNIEVAGPHTYFVRADGSDGPGVWSITRASVVLSGAQVETAIQSRTPIVTGRIMGVSSRTSQMRCSMCRRPMTS